MADVFFVGVDVHERLAWARKRKTGSRLLAQPAAEDDQQVAFFVGEVLRILVRRQHVAGVVRMIVREGVLPFVRGQHRELKFFGEVDDFLPRVRVLRSRTDHEHRFTRRIDAPDQRFNGRRIGIGRERRNRRAHGDVGVAFGDVARQRHHHRTGPAGARDMKRPAHDARDLFGIVDLDDPLGDAAEEAAVVDLLAGFAAARVAADLADQQHHAALNRISRCGRRCSRWSRRGRG